MNQKDKTEIDEEMSDCVDVVKTEDESQIKQESGDKIESQIKEGSDDEDESQIKQESGDKNESQIKEGSGDEDESQIKEESGDKNKMYAKIWRVPDKEDGRPNFIMCCPLCEAGVSDLVGHIKGNHKGTDWRGIQTPCPFEDCNKVVVDIRNHITKVHLKIKNFGCDLCDVKFASGPGLKNHVNGVHTNLREKCPHCDIMFKVTTIKMHIRNVHENVKPRVACTEKDCGKTFLSKSDMNRHVASVHEKIKYPCPECGKDFHVDSLAKHIQMIHKQIYPYYCKQCEKGFQVLKDLHTHIRTKHYKDFVLCENLNSNGEMCGKKMRNEEALKKHVDRIHLKTEDIKNPKVICPECGVKIFQESLQRHIDVIHLKIKNKSCTVENCKEIFTSKYGLKRHVDKVHNKVTNREWCDICEEFKLNLKSHFRQMHTDREKVPCDWPQCDYQAKTSFLVKQHIRNIHEDKPRVKCDECGKSVKDLYGHKKMTHRKIEDIYFCQDCDKGFPQKHKLREHISKIHLKLRCTCPECGLDIAAGYLKSHLTFVHEKRIGAVCDVPGCGTTFNNNATKLKHIKQVHEGIRDTCPECGKQVSDLRNHIKVVHKKERPHECQECKKTYQTKTHLQNHIKTFHLGMRVKCDECGKMVTDIYSHRASAHREGRKFPCDQCETRCATSNQLKTHILSVHLGVKEHCDICNKDVAAGYMSTHIKNHMKTEEEKKPHICPQCEKPFKDPGTLKKHIERTHLNIKKECPRCGLETKDLHRHMKYTNCESDTYSPRRQKMLRVDCPQCEKPFRDPGTLRKHIERTHLNIKEECPRCGLETKDLYQHLNYTKCGSETYSRRRQKMLKLTKVNCPHCEEPFRDPETLRKHIERTHLNIKEKMLKVDERRTKSIHSYFPASLSSGNGSTYENRDAEGLPAKAQEIQK